MMNLVQVVDAKVDTLDNVNLREAYALVPAIESKCREIKKEVKKRISDNGDLEGLKEYEENAGVKVTDVEKFFDKVKNLISREDFISKCVTVNLTAVKKIAIPLLQEKALEDGVKMSKIECGVVIDRFALECGEQKTKKTII